MFQICSRERCRLCAKDSDEKLFKIGFFPQPNSPDSLIFLLRSLHHPDLTSRKSKKDNLTHA